uniref:Uncharacterized protein n=1 Tax=Picea glauca TaxID=3330 RepID=A0A117NGD5_PICGL|nr:hypothetical protein ABT39_MTgene1320 [Picea glauca]
MAIKYSVNLNGPDDVTSRRKSQFLRVESEKEVLAILLRCTLRTEMHSSHFDRSIENSTLPSHLCSSFGFAPRPLGRDA